MLSSFFLLLNINFEILKTMLHLNIKQMKRGLYLQGSQSLKIKSDNMLNVNIKFKHEKMIS